MLTTAQKMVLFGARRKLLTLTATTAAPGATVTIQRLTPTGGTCTINWGDGSSTTVANGSTSAITHVYAEVGSYSIVITNKNLITGIDLRDVQIGGFNTVHLKNNVMNYFYCTAITSSVISSADMSSWMPTNWQLVVMPTGTYSINSSDMSNWRPTTWQLSSMPSGTYNFNSANISEWRPTTWQLHTMPSGTYNFNSSDVAGWNPTTWRLYNIPVGTYNFTAANLSGWIAVNAFRADSLALSQAKVDAILNGHWLAFPTRTAVAGTINVGGTNAAPSGILQAANPPTTGKEFAYELVNDSQNVNPTKKWATVTITA